MSIFYIKLLLFFKNSIFSDFRSIKFVLRPIENALIFKAWICLVWLMLDWCSINQICFSIDWTNFSTDRNFGKLDFLKNSRNFVQKTLKSIDFMNEMHEYEFKSFSKTFVFNPKLSKTRLWHLFAPKFQSKEHILYQKRRICKVVIYNYVFCWL